MLSVSYFSNVRKSPFGIHPREFLIFLEELRVERKGVFNEQSAGARKESDAVISA